jgi:hypothetical protein
MVCCKENEMRNICDKVAQPTYRYIPVSAFCKFHEAAGLDSNVFKNLLEERMKK